MPSLTIVGGPTAAKILDHRRRTNRFPAGYPREGLTFELVGSLESITWPPFGSSPQRLDRKQRARYFCRCEGPPGYCVGHVFLNDEFSA